MKVIKYQMLQGDGLCDVAIGYNEINLKTAEKEAYNGKYTVEEIEEPVTEENI